MIKLFLKSVKILVLLLEDFFARKMHPIRIHSTQETLLELIHSHQSISRFGDGEFNLVLGKSLKFQNIDEQMSTRLKAILMRSDSSNKCLIGIPYSLTSVRGLTTSSKKFWRMYSAKYRRELSPILNSQYTYWDSQISRIYINRSDKKVTNQFFSMWKRIWKDQKILIVEGEYSRLGVNNDLFDTAASVQRLLCPAHNAFSVYESILKSVIQMKDDIDLVLVALGPTATIMAYDLAAQGMWAIDTGNLDMEYEWKKQSASKQIPVAGKFTIEAKNGESTESLDDPSYESQVVGRVGL